MMQSTTTRLWRARKRHDQLDAILAADGSDWELRYVLNRRVLLRRTYATDGEARSAAAARLRELQRAGWGDHW